MQKTDDEPVNVVIQHEVPVSRDAEFRNIIAEITNAMTAFPGFLGKHIFHGQHANKITYTVLCRFDTLEHLRAWEQSEIRAELRKRMEAITEQQPAYHFLTGLETWFSLGVKHPIIPPPRYKMAIITWVCIYSLLVLVFTLFGSYLSQLIMPVRLLIVSFILVFLMTYVVMPNITRLLVKWLYPNRK